MKTKFSSLLKLLAANVLIFVAIDVCTSFFLTPVDRQSTYEQSFDYRHKAIMLDDVYFGLDIPNPLFGYSANPQLKDFITVNNYGFTSEYAFPYIKKDDEFVIAFLGGSVAEILCMTIEESPDLQQKFKEALNITHKKLIFLNMAKGGMKQPQQFHISTNFLESYDLAINIDGYNDVVLDSGYKYPVDFPYHTERLFYLTEEKIATTKEQMRYRYIQSVLTLAPIKFSILNKSSLYFLMWKSLYNILDKKINDLSFNFPKGKFTVNSEYPESLDSFDKFLIRRNRKKIKVWSKYTKLQFEINKLSDKKIVFFIQPNQYFKGSKVFFSEKEKNVAFIKNETQASYQIAQLEQLKNEGINLKREGIPLFILSDIYRDVKESVFVDNCCHVNQLGNELLAKAIIEKIQR